MGLWSGRLAQVPDLDLRSRASARPWRLGGLDKIKKGNSRGSDPEVRRRSGEISIMLKSFCTRIVAGLVWSLLTISCAHRVDVRPNMPVGSEIPQTLVLANDTVYPLTIISLPGSGKAPLVLQPSEETRLSFTLRLEENTSAGHEMKVALVRARSSPYLTQSSIDLLMKARFGHGPPREIRVRLGNCLFDSAQSQSIHELLLKEAPSPSVPALQLCP